MGNASGFKNSSRMVMLCAMLVAVSASVSQAAFTHQNSNRVTIKLNRSWWFIGSDGSYSGTSLNDSTGSWSKVCLPQQNITLKHMYFSGGTVGTGAGAAYMFTSWYRKHYMVPTTFSGRRFILQFEGVATLANVYVNGTQVGTHTGAYTPFSFDVTNNITTGADNVIAVQVNSNPQTSVPPEGGTIDYCLFGGIVRNVRLIITDPLHVEWNWVSIPNATSQTSTPAGTITSHVKAVNNAATSKTCVAITSIVDATGNVVATGTGSATIAAGGSSVITYATTTGSVTHFWSPDNPYLHTVYTQLLDGATYVDEFADTTGFRTIFPLTPGTAYSGIYINGTKYHLIGLNRHESFPYFGRAAARRVQRKDADILKYDLGCNLVRCSHYTQAPDFIKRCDEIGLMLIQEVPGWSYLGGTAWTNALMQDLKDMIYRDRNHPSVISFGVRVNESADNDAVYGPMVDTAHAIDPTRPTHGVRRSNGSTASFLEDIWTRNFADATSSGPFPWITTETVGHTITPQVHSWDNDVTQFGQVNAHVTEQNSSYGNTYLMGKLGWCAFDYHSPHSNATTNETSTTTDVTGRSKSSPYLSMHGVSSVFRIPKLAGYLFQSQRNPATCGYMVSIANDWLSTSPTTVTVFSNCGAVELFLNGVSQGIKAGNLGTNLPHPGFTWALTYTAGTLRADGYASTSRGTLLATTHVSTPSAPTKLVLTPDDTVIEDGGDMTRVVVSLVDTSGRAIRSRADSITMSATGAGTFIGEARSALEGGQFAFWVKSSDGVFGTITCMATDITTSGITAGNTAVTVVGAPTDVKHLASFSSMNIQKILFTKVWGTRLTLPSNVPENARISVYDIAGKLVYQKTVQSAKVVNLGKTINAANAVYIVKIETGKAVAVK
jgi:beta-galactosidase